jgi:DNA polymerase-1
MTLRPPCVLIDGYAVLYRAFFAMISRPVHTQAGEHTGTVWVVATFLMRTLETLAPSKIVWIQDAGDSFRTAAYPDYKSTRAKLSGELKHDFERALAQTHKLLTAFGIPAVSVAGYEADDVIGTLAVQAADAGMEAVIVSGDKDFLQLVRPGIALLNPGRGGKSAVAEEWVREDTAHARLGVPPHQVTDYLALVGDSSDGVPGVHGIGPKGARALLATYPDLEAVLAAAPTLSAKGMRERLLTHADTARLSKQLVTIQTDVPGAPSLTDLARLPIVPEVLHEALTQLEFTTLLPRATALCATTAPAPAPPRTP